MTFKEHFKALAKTLIPCFILFILLFGYCVIYGDYLLELVLQLGKDKYTFVYLAPQDVLIQTFKLSGFIALWITIPYLFIKLVLFFMEDLKLKYKVIAFFSIILILVLFLIGVFLGGSFLLPYVLNFLSSYSEVLARSMITVQNFISFVQTVCVSLGFVLEMPVIAYVLAKIGVLTSSFMLKFKSVMIVVIFIISAIITPPDVVSQMGVALPMVLLYFLSIVIVKLVERRKRKCQ